MKEISIAITYVITIIIYLKNFNKILEFYKQFIYDFLLVFSFNISIIKI